MTDNVQNLVIEILKQIQADITVLKTDVSVLKTDVADIRVRGERLETRVESLEAHAKRQRRDSAAMLVMMRSVVGTFEERLRDVENDVRVMMEQDP